MKELIEAFPENIKEAIQIAESSSLKQPQKEVKTMVSMQQILIEAHLCLDFLIKNTEE